MKRNFIRCNRGFSLVELIVVIAIMAALVAILAPQYIKYVRKSRATVCETNLVSAARAYDIERIDSPLTHAALLEQVITDMGGVLNSNGKYTGLCPSGGLLTALFFPDGSVKLTCDTHRDNSAPDFQSSLVSLVLSGQISRVTDKGNNQTLLQYLDSAVGKSVDSEAPSSLSDGVFSFTGLIKKELGESISGDQSWRLVKESGSYVLYVTTGGRLAEGDKGKTVSAVKYTFNAKGEQVGDGQNVTVSVGTKDSYLVLKT
jgi:prepilin-type N-terminal cleavage/methylation domain-containing protein